MNMMNLDYDLCPICGRVIGLRDVVCVECKNDPDTDFQIKKRQTLERLYGYDITEWNGIKVSPGYSEEEGRAALRDLLFEIKERSMESQRAV